MKLKETRILDAEGARYACIANDYCTRCDCEEYDRILSGAARPAANRAASRLTIWPALPKRSRPSAKRTTTCPLSLLRFPGAPCPALSRPNLNSPVFVGFSIMK